MAAGDTWSGSYTVPGEAAGYYRVMANAYTHGPGGGLFLYDDVVRSAWMFVSATNGQLTRWFEDSLFPKGVHPVAGPATADGAMASRPDSTKMSWHEDSVFLHVVYTISEDVGFKPAVGARIGGTWLGNDGQPEGRTVTVPEDGIVAFGCRRPRRILGIGYAPYTDLVQGRWDLAYWSATSADCGQLLQVEVEAHKYLPWRLLNLAADTLQKHFGHTRGRIDWKLAEWWNPYNYYNPVADKITLKWGGRARNISTGPPPTSTGTRCTTRRSAACGGSGRP